MPVTLNTFGSQNVPPPTPKQYDRVTYLEKFSYGTGWMAQGLVSVAAITYLLMYYNQVLGVNLLWATVAMAIGKLGDAISDPIMGWISDNTKWKAGRRKPWIVVGGCLWALTIYFTVNPPMALRGSEKALLYYLGFMMVLDTTFLTMMLVPYASLTADSSEHPDDRISLAAYRTWFSAAGKMLSPLLVKHWVQDYYFELCYPKFIIFPCLLLCFVLIFPRLFCKERVRAVTKREAGPPWYASWQVVFSDLRLTANFLAIILLGLATLSTLFGTKIIMKQWPVLTVADREFSVFWALIPGIILGFVLTVAAAFGFLHECQRKQVPNLGKWILVVSNKPFLCMCAALIFGFVGLSCGAMMLPWIAQFHLLGREAESDFMMLGFGVPLIAIPIWRLVASKLGMKYMLMVVLLMAAMTFALSFVMIRQLPGGEEWTVLNLDFHLFGWHVDYEHSLLFGPIGLAWAICLGFANGGLMFLPAAIIPDVIDFDTLRSGENRAGIFYGVESFALRMAGVPSMILASLLVELSGVIPDDPTLTKADYTAPIEAVTNLRLICATLPAALMLIGFVVFFFYSLTPKRVTEVRAELARQREAEESE